MASASPLPFSHVHCGANVALTMDCLTARRAKSYNHAVVVSAAPLEEDLLYQVMVKELSSKRFVGCLRVGVTTLSPETVCGWAKWTADTDTSGNSVALDRTDDGQLCTCCKGKKIVVSNCQMDLRSLTVGESLGVLCTTQHGLQFFINGQLVKTPSPLPLPLPAAGPRYLFVDVYGPVTAVEVLPAQSRDCVVQRVGEVPSGAGRVEGIQCQYFDLCRRFLSSMRCTIADEFFNWSHCKCYCPECYDTHSQPKVKSKGQPPENYATPTGWAKFALCVPKRAEVLNVFRDWHVCYHGTPVDSVAPILECGQLMIRDDLTLPSHQPVPCPRTHFNETFKPVEYNVRQIFLSPSLHYCTHGEVYAGSQRCVDSSSDHQYTAKVAFQLRVHPRACTISQQTTQKTDTRIDPCIPNNRLEWSTVYRSSTILTALCVKLVETSMP